MFEPREERYLEASRMTPQNSWERLYDAEEILTGDSAAYVKLAGEIPGTNISRSSVFKIPETSGGLGEITANRVMEINIPASDIGELASAKWKACLNEDETLLIGAELLKALARSGGGFNELPAILLQHKIQVANRPAANALIGVEVPTSGSFAEARLKIHFRYLHEAAFSPIVQADGWLTQIGEYIVARGLTETLIAMLGEGKKLNDLLEAGKEDLPFPNDLPSAVSFYNLLPETLRLKSRVHGVSQLQLGEVRSEVRIPLSPMFSPELSEILNQSKLAIELQKHNFTISYYAGLADFMPDLKRGTRDGPEPIADILKTITRGGDFRNLSFGKAARDAANYVGPYLHIAADHGPDYESRFEAQSGILLFILRFREYIKGLSSINSSQDQE